MYSGIGTPDFFRVIYDQIVTIFCLERGFAIVLPEVLALISIAGGLQSRFVCQCVVTFKLCDMRSFSCHVPIKSAPSPS
jgi:hypothetical protein